MTWKSPSRKPRSTSPVLLSAVVATFRHAFSPAEHAKEVAVGQTVGKRAFKALAKKYTDLLDGLLDQAKNASERPNTPVKQIKEIFRSAYLMGVRAAGHRNPVISKEDASWIEKAAETEARYLRKFLSDVNAGRGKMEYDKRKQMYIKTLEYMYEVGRISSGSDNVLIYWVIDSHAENCPHCRFLAANSPYTKRTLPTVPRAGDTQCLSNCKCRLVVRHATPFDVSRVVSNQKDADTMLRRMRSESK